MQEEAKVISLRQLQRKKYNFLDGLPEDIEQSFGKLTKNFILIVWGNSGNGKSNFILQILKCLMGYGSVLYVSYEEGTEASMQVMAHRHLNKKHSGRIRFADASMSYQALFTRLDKKRSEQFIVIDSIQYMGISYKDYKQLKEAYPNKSFIFLSHANGRKPRGKVAEDIMYDATIKCHIEGYVVDVKSRLKLDGLPVPYVVWEDGAKKVWGRNWKNPFTKTKRKK